MKTLQLCSCGSPKGEAGEWEFNSHFCGSLSQKAKVLAREIRANHSRSGEGYLEWSWDYNHVQHRSLCPQHWSHLCHRIAGHLWATHLTLLPFVEWVNNSDFRLSWASNKITYSWFLAQFLVWYLVFSKWGHCSRTFQFKLINICGKSVLQMSNRGPGYAITWEGKTQSSSQMTYYFLRYVLIRLQSNPADGLSVFQWLCISVLWSISHWVYVVQHLEQS